MVSMVSGIIIQFGFAIESKPIRYDPSMMKNMLNKQFFKTMIYINLNNY